MINQIKISSIMVLDQDEALDFYVNKLGLEVASDIQQGPVRWLTVRVPGDHGHEIYLQEPGPPALDEATADKVRELVTQGAIGFVAFTTDDCKGLYETLKARGVKDSSPRSRPSTSTASTWASATPSATTSGSCSLRRSRRRCLRDESVRE